MRIPYFLIIASFLVSISTAASAQSSSRDWSGPYAGLHAGWIYAGFTNSVPTLPGPTQDAGSAIGGFQLGYNWQNGQMVYGAEIDASIMDLTGRSPGGNFAEESMGSLRVRAGQIIGGKLFYGSIGVAWTEKKSGLAGLGSTTDYEPGFMVGGGVEKWLSDTMTGRLEAFYVDVPKSRQNVGGVTVSGGSQNAILRAAVNLHF